MTASKAKGTRFESAVVAYLRNVGRKAARNGPAGGKDVGDAFVEIYPEGCVLQIKDDGHHRIGEWLRKAEEQRDNYNEAHQCDQLPRFAVVIKERRGSSQTGAVKDAWVVMRLREFI